MKLLLTLVLVLLGVSPALAVERWVSQAGAGTTDGSTYANRFAGWADAMATPMAAGDILRVCGTLSTGAPMVWDGLGTDPAHVVLMGICPEEGTVRGTLDGLDVAAPTLSVRFSYSDVQDIDIINSAGDCLLFSSAGAGAGFNRVQRTNLNNCDVAGVHSQKASTLIANNIITNIGDDGINLNSNAPGAMVRNNSVTNFSTLTSTGDGIASNTGIAGDVLIENNTCVFSNFNSSKSCIIGGNASGTYTVRENTVSSTDLQLAITGVNSGIAVTRCVTCNVYRNRVSGFYAGLIFFNDTSAALTTVNAYSNDVSDNYFGIRAAPTSVGSPTFNFYNNTGRNLYYGVSMGQGATIFVTLNHYNNIWTAINHTLGVPFYGLLVQQNSAYNGNGNVYFPEGPSFMRNLACGGTALNSTMLAYLLKCPQESQSLSVIPGFVSTTDHHLTPRSPVLGIGTYWPNRHNCYDFDRVYCNEPPDPGAYQLSGTRQR